MRTRHLAWLAAVILLPAWGAFAQTAVSVHLDLYDGDKYSHAFSDGIRNAVTGESRLSTVTVAKTAGLRIIMNEGISSDSDNGSDVASYKLTLKTGKGKFIGDTTGYCEVRRFDMCGRVALADSLELYDDYMTKHPE